MDARARPSCSPHLQMDPAKEASKAPPTLPRPASASSLTDSATQILPVASPDQCGHASTDFATIHQDLTGLDLSEPSNEGDLTDTLEHMESFEVPSVFVNSGLLLLKVSHKSKKKVRLWVDAANFRFVYKQISKSSSHSFYVDDIRSITPRELASHYREELGISKEVERRWISIGFFDHRKNKTKLLHLIADTSHDAKRLLYTVGKFKTIKDKIANDFLVDLKDLDEVKRSILSGKAESSDRSTKQVLSFADVLKYCKRLSINVNETRLRQLFARVTESATNEIGFSDFKRFVVLLTRRDDIAALYSGLTGGGSSLTFAAFCSFVTDVQREQADYETLLKIYKKHAATLDSALSPDSAPGMTEEQFAAYLKSRYCSVSKEVFQEEGYFSRPLNEYFILSSHNTYLTGRQVGGDSSVEGYVRALQRGCRCLEIDVWNSPGDSGAEPIVNHGRTFTSGISLSNVLATIKKFAFQTTRFPLILSLEVHCSTRGQALMTKILKDVFGTALVDYPIDTRAGLPGRAGLPSPAELRDRVLIKVKKSNDISDSVDESGRALTSSSTTQTSFSESAESGITQRFKIRRRPSSKVSEGLSALGVYCQGVKFRNFSLPESKTFNHCFSLSEKSVNSMLRDPEKAAALDKHNRRFFMRVYPSKIRLMSSNFVPLVYWEHGVQMVATNWQTYDLGQQLNEAYFDVAQGRGYVLKPAALRQPVGKTSGSKLVKNGKNEGLVSEDRAEKGYDSQVGVERLARGETDAGVKGETKEEIQKETQKETEKKTERGEEKGQEKKRENGIENGSSDNSQPNSSPLQISSANSSFWQPPRPTIPKVRTIFRIEVISAQQLPKPQGIEHINPFVTVELVGARAIEWGHDSQMGATGVVAENGFNPIWNSAFYGSFYADTELVFVRLTVHTSGAKHVIESPKEIGLSVTNLFDLKQGYRHFPLKDLCGESLVYSSLFVRLEYRHT